MKRISNIVTTVAAMSIAATQLRGAPAGAVVEPVPNPHSIEQGRAFGNLLKASELIGMPVERGNREAAGKVEDIVVGLETGRVVAVLVSMNENSTLRAVPPGVLHLDLLQNVIHLKTSPAKLAAAPILERPTWKKSLAPERLAALYRHFDVEPPFATSGKRKRDALPRLGVTEMATRLDGAPVINLNNERIGQVHNCMVDLSTGRIPFVILSTGDSIGEQGALTPVPAQAMSYDKARATLVLDKRKDSLAKLPHFKTGSWPDMTKGSYVANVYAAYGIEPREASTPAPIPENTAR